MNKRMFSLVLMASALPVFASARSLSLDRGDFRAAQRVSRNGQTIVSVKLSKSGKAKVRRLGGVAAVSEPTLEMGPYAEDEADAVIASINRK